VGVFAKLRKATVRGQLKCDDTRAETTFRLSAKRTSSFKSAGASVQSTTGSRGVRVSGSNDGYTMFRGSVKSTGYPLNSPVSPSLLLPCVTVCHYISTGLYLHHVCSSIDMEQLDFHWTDFYEIYYLSIFRQSVVKDSCFKKKSDRNNSYFMYRPIYIYDKR